MVRSCETLPLLLHFNENKERVCAHHLSLGEYAFSLWKLSFVIKGFARAFHNGSVTSITRILTASEFHCK